VAFLKNKERIRELHRLRAVYDSREGRAELCRLVVEGAVFSTFSPDDPDFMELCVKRNSALQLLYGLGVLVDDNIPVIIDRLMDIDYSWEV
jgi:hypothetical protein